MRIELQDLQTTQAIASALGPVLEEARQGVGEEDRSSARHPFFRPVTVTLKDGTRCSAFSRDLSETGIGLMHSADLPMDDVEIRILTGLAYSVNVQTRIVWCHQSERGWYMSGGQFISVPVKSVL
jgi:hypothetical protein